MKGLLKDYTNRILALLFSISISVWILDSFNEKLLPQTLLLVFILNSLVFIGMTQAGKSPLKLFLFVFGSVLYAAAVYAIISYAQQDYSSHYLIWLATLGQDSKNTIAEFMMATILMICYMFSAIVFYFSCIRDRIGILFMTGFIPLLLQTAKTSKEITLPFLLFVILFFCLYIGKNLRMTMMDSEKHTKLWYLASVTCFTLVVLGLSLVLPKPLVQPKLAELDSVVAQALRPLLNAAPSEELAGSDTYTLQLYRGSVELDKASPPTSDRILFQVEASEPLYLRVQSHDRYNLNRWFSASPALKQGYPVSDLFVQNMKPYALAGMLGALEEQELLDLGLSSPGEILSFSSQRPQFNRALIQMNRVSADFFLTTPGVFSLQPEASGIEAIINDLNYCYPSSLEKLQLFEEYQLDYFSQEIPVLSTEMAVIRQMHADIYTAFRKNRQTLFEKYEENIKQLPFSEAEMMAILFSSDQEFELAYNNFTDLPHDLPERIYQLAESITSGETSNYGKALALENYFQSSGFRYDLSPPRLPYGRDVNDYFLFESRRGFCVHFASAMVILARASGLPARYTEGYISDEWNEQEKLYNVRAKDAHAFPEIYIPGFGWMIFEPTVSAESGNDFFASLKHIAGQIKTFMQSVARMLRALPIAVKLLYIPFMILGAFFLLWLFTSIRYSTWLKKTMKADGNMALKRIFVRLAARFKIIRIEMKKSDTPSTYAARVLDEKGIDIRGLAEAYNKTRYGGYQIPQEELQSFLKLYHEVTAGLKAQIRGPKGWLLR
ncbi:MAG: transglutaminase domain-containing protein [Thermoclostridium sp.]|nr:transglutaminase domain-containing protein [Thermoclostridium sp.]